MHLTACALSATNTHGYTQILATTRLLVPRVRAANRFFSLLSPYPANSLNLFNFQQVHARNSSINASGEESSANEEIRARIGRITRNSQTSYRECFRSKWNTRCKRLLPRRGTTDQRINLKAVALDIVCAYVATKNNFVLLRAPVS